jgi:DNA-binding MarR family transcriptional regulator
MARRTVPAAAPLWDTDRIDSLLSWTLVRAHLVRIPLFFQALQPLDLTPTHFGVLVQLSNTPGLSQARLARRALMTPQSMGELLLPLERAGLVARGERTGRGRPIPVSLTEAGRRLLEEATPLVDAIDTAASFGLTAAEKAQLNALLHKVVRHVTDDRPADDPDPG